MRSRAPVGVYASVSVLSSVSCLSPPFPSPSPTGPSGDLLSPPFLSPSPTGPAGDAEQTHGNAYIVVADGRSFVIVPSVHPVVAINDAKWDQCLKADLETLQVRSNPARGIGREWESAASGWDRP